MPPEENFTKARIQGWNLQLQKMLSGIRRLFAMQKFTAELILSRYCNPVNTGFSITKGDSHLQNGNLGYKKRILFTTCDFSFYKRDSNPTIYPKMATTDFP